MVVLAPLPGGSYRVVATVDEAPEHPDAAYVQALLDARGPARERAVVKDVVWSSRFRVHHRVADSYPRAACCWRATRRTCTALRAVRA